MHIHIIITGFGQPYLDTKIQIAHHNRQKYNRSHHKTTVTAYVYDNSPIPEGLFDHIIRHPGYVGEFIYGVQNDNPIYDRILLILDDVQWVSDFDEYISVCETLMSQGAESGIFQPSLSSDSLYSHHHMLMHGSPKNHIDTDFHRHKCFEYFCYYMTPTTFEKYRSLLTPKTRCMWGLDFIVSAQIQCFLFQAFKIRHWFTGGMLDRNACVQEMNDVFRQFHMR